jgi:4'-phosphopantetheinyl transferase
MAVQVVHIDELNPEEFRWIRETEKWEWNTGVEGVVNRARNSDPECRLIGETLPPEDENGSHGLNERLQTGVAATGWSLSETSEKTLSVNLVQVWCARLNFAAAPSEFEEGKLLKMLSAEERQRYALFRFDIDRISYLLAHALQRLMIGRIVGCEPQELRFGRGPFGKPFLLAPRDRPSIEFSLTHAEGLVACAVSNHPVGLDAEWSKRELDLGMAPSVLSGLELADLDRTPEARRSQRFLEYWTLKEAFIKATGRGLSQPLGRFWFHLRETQEPKINFARGEQYHAKLWRFAQPKELSPSHEIAVAVSLPPGQKRTLES